MIELNSDLPAELVPLSWLLGVWEGTGVVHYTVGDDVLDYEFGQRVSFSQDGLPYLNYNSYSWLLDDSLKPLVTESGYWRLNRPAVAGDPGPGMLSGTGDRPFATAEDVETLRNANEGFDLQVSIVHPGGINELYLGQVKGPRIDLATDAVMRASTAKEYAAATRIYGLVEGHLLWAWDIAALGQDLRTHSSGRLARVD
ncbi:FABP family protein [Glaciihabitans sp. dw_435]|uniref:FABP family protein n=1 Tax=Glaciihabitans sp. dw_435 TaxID=2720081 RepID=UPI001BD2030F|nr:FABP family protein [Glaciihabitans sp. dw_435]